MPSCRATASAVRRLSPVSITVWTPRRCSSVTATFADGLIRSATADHAQESSVHRYEHGRLAVPGQALDPGLATPQRHALLFH